MKLLEVAMGKSESELNHHKKSEQGDKFHEKMKVGPFYSTCVVMYTCALRIISMYSYVLYRPT